MQWAIFLAEKLNKANKICLPQHVLDLVLLEQQVDRIFYSYCFENYEICVL